MARATAVTDARWEEHDRAWRDPAEVVALWPDVPHSGGSLLAGRAVGPWWELLDELRLCLLVTREYEHVLVALVAGANGREVSYLPVPHPSGLAVDAARRRVVVACTRNPNQILELVPCRIDGRRTLLPTRTTFLPGRLYLHDVAYVGGELHGNAVGLNSVVRLPEGGGHDVVWWPRSVERRGRPDTTRNYLQLNSIAAGETLAASYFSASAEAPGARFPGQRHFPVDGRGVVFSGETRAPALRGLTRPHSARLHGGRLWVANSGYGELVVAEDGRPQMVSRLDGWTRGLSFARGIAFVGTSRVIPRFHRYAPGLDVGRSVCGVAAVDVRSGETVAKYVWPHGNQVFAVEAVPRSAFDSLPFRAREGRARARQAFSTMGGA